MLGSVFLRSNTRWKTNLRCILEPQEHSSDYASWRKLEPNGLCQPNKMQRAFNIAAFGNIQNHKMLPNVHGFAAGGELAFRPPGYWTRFWKLIYFFYLTRYRIGRPMADVENCTTADCPSVGPTCAKPHVRHSILKLNFINVTVTSRRVLKVMWTLRITGLSPL
jgi:hypothetical protein